MKIIKWLWFFSLLSFFIINSAVAKPILTKQQENFVKAMVNAMAANNLSENDKILIINRIINAANQGKAQEILIRQEVDEPWILFCTIMYTSRNKIICTNYDDECRTSIATDSIKIPPMTRQEEQAVDELAEKKLIEVGLGPFKYTN